jgi:hypothetical protein
MADGSRSAVLEADTAAETAREAKTEALEGLTLDITARVTRIGRAEPQTRRASRGPA